MQQEIENLEKLAASGDISAGGFQHKQRLINILNKQIEQKEASLNEKQNELNELKETFQYLKQEHLKVSFY